MKDLAHKGSTEVKKCKEKTIPFCRKTKTIKRHDGYWRIWNETITPVRGVKIQYSETFSKLMDGTDNNEKRLINELKQPKYTKKTGLIT